MCVCVCVCMYVCMHACMYVCTGFMYVESIFFVGIWRLFLFSSLLKISGESAGLSSRKRQARFIRREYRRRHGGFYILSLSLSLIYIYIYSIILE